MDLAYRISKSASDPLDSRTLHLERQINHFFCGETFQRIQTAIDLIDWILEHLKSSKIET
jgi:hypothetical protein